MRLRRFVPCAALLALGIALSPQAHADGFSFSGNLSADNTTVEIVFANSTTQNYTFATSSFASGGFFPVLTLFDSAGNPAGVSPDLVDADAVLNAILTPGMYELFLTEFPNVAIGTLSDGFLFASDPTITGDLCGISGGMFIDDITCTQRTSRFAIAATTSAVTPEPSTWLLVLPPALFLAAYTNRRRSA